MSKYIQRVTHSFQTDVTWHKTIDLVQKGGRALPRATADYVLDKFPIIGWLPRYDWRWIPNDLIAGLTLCMMLVPQSLAYASIAKIPVEFGLMSAWFPGTLYAFMGTTKGSTSHNNSLLRNLKPSRSVDWSYFPYWPSHG